MKKFITPNIKYSIIVIKNIMRPIGMTLNITMKYLTILVVPSSIHDIIEINLKGINRNKTLKMIIQ